MDGRRRRATYYIGAFATLVVCYVFVYQFTMGTFEGEPRTLTESVLTVVESITTTGYGEDANAWNSVPTVLLVTAMNFTGVVFIFMTLPLFVVPWLEERLETTIPDAVERTDHVVVAGFTDRSRELIEELTTRDVPVVVIEDDRDRAASLTRTGKTVLHGDPTAVEALARANATGARAIVADVDDESNASIALAASECAPDVDVITLVEDPEIAEYHEYAGADSVLSPRHLVADSLATKVTSGVDAELADTIEITPDFEIVELPVQSGSELVGRRVADSEIRERTGANIVGAWFRGEFLSPPTPDVRIDARTILLVAGREPQLEAVKALTRSEQRTRGRGRVLVCGFGEVGSTIKRTLTAEGVECRSIDVRDDAGVDVVGDVTEREPFEEAGIEDASSVILALPDDRTAVFATLVIRQITETVDVIARANSTENVGKLYRAGANYVLALSTVSGRMLASTILDEDVISFGQQIDVARLEAGRLVGQRLEPADVRARTGCTVVAVERDGEVVADIPPSFTFEAGDDVIVAGPDDGVAELHSITEA